MADDGNREAAAGRVSRQTAGGMARSLRAWREAYAREHGRAPDGTAVRAWWAEGIATDGGVLHWSPGYVTPDGVLTGAVGAVLPARLPRRADAAPPEYAYYTVGYWDADQARAGARAAAVGLRGVAEGRSGWSAARVVPGRAGERGSGGGGAPAVERSPHLYATLAEAQAAAERFHSCALRPPGGDAPGPEAWPAPAADEAESR